MPPLSADSNKRKARLDSSYALTHEGLGSGLPDQAPAYTGWDVITTPADPIAALNVFLDDMGRAHL